MLSELLRQRSDAIIERWLEAVLRTYPSEAFKAFVRQRDRFANPVGHSLRAGTRAIFDALVEGAGADAVRAGLDEMVRIRSVQELAPSEGVGFVFALKDAVRAELGEMLDDPDTARELVSFERSVDGAALAAFDLQTEYRARVYELRIAELKRTIPWVVKRADRAVAVGGEG